MKKQEFLDAVRQRLDGLSEEEKKKCLDFLSEGIDDRTEDGMTEEEAVEAMGSIDENVSALLADMPLKSVIKAKMKPKHNLSGLAIFLIILGSPLWLPLVIAGIAVIFSIFAAVLSCVIAVICAVAGIFITGIGGVVGFAALLIAAKPLSGVFMLGGGLAAAGLALLLVPAVIFLVKLFIRFCVAVPKFLKTRLIRR